MSKLRELIGKATPGPWRARSHPSLGTWIDAPDAPVENDRGPNYSREILEGDDYDEKTHDAALIVHLRNNAEAIADLLDAAAQASFCLRELLPNDADAQMTVRMLNDARARIDE